MIYLKFRGPPGPNFWLVALRAALTSSFAPFRRSGRVTHARLRIVEEGGYPERYGGEGEGEGEKGEEGLVLEYSRKLDFHIFDKG